MSKLKIFLISLIVISIANVVSKSIHFDSVRMSAIFALFVGALIWAIISITNRSVIEKEKAVSKVEDAKSKVSGDDSALYLNAMNELKENRNEALWAKCYAENNGDNSKSEATYIRLRVGQLKISEPILENDFEKYRLYSGEHLYRNKLYTEKKHKGHNYFLLANNNAAVKIGNYVSIYISEADLVRALNTNNIGYGAKVAFKDKADS